MQKIFLLLFLVALAGAYVLQPTKQEAKIRYDNYAVYKITLRNGKQRGIFEKLAEIRENYNLWHSTGNEMHIMVNPKEMNYFKNLIHFLGIKYELKIPNVQSLIDEEGQSVVEKAAGATFGWTRYYPLASIESWLDEILATYPEVTEGFVIGKSFEGRNIRGIKISYKSNNPGIFIESNIHAREWITSASATWFINQLLTSTDAQVRALAENHDWYIVPVLNVDGFVYTHERDRLWRKTRQPVANSACIGTDPNRNYDSHWMEAGASSNPCSDTYGGPKPFSEPEIKAMADFIGSIKNKLNILLAFHSYSQLMLSPYGHSAEEFPDNYADLQSVAGAFVNAVASLPYKTNYKYGSSASVLYVTSGAVTDWVYNTQDIKLAYTIELRDTGRYGFVLPPVNIIPNSEEVLTGILALVKEADKLGYLQSNN